MADKPIELKDLIDIGKGLDKLIADFAKLEKVATKSIDNIAKSGKRFSDNFVRTQKEIEDNVKSTQKLRQENKKSTAQLEKNAKELKGLAKESRDFKEAQKSAAKVSKELGGSINDQKERVKQLQKEYDALDPKVAGNRQKMQALGRQIAKTRIEIKELTDNSRKLNTAFDASQGSYNDLIKQNKRIRATLNKLPPEFLETNKRAQQLKKTYAENTAKLKEFDKGLGQNFRNVGNYNDLLGKVGGPGGGLAKIAGPAAIAGALAAGGALLAKEIERLNKSLKTAQKLTKLQGKDLQAFTAQAQAVADVYDKDFNEVLKASNVLIKEFGVSGSESVDLVQQALIRGVDINDDFLDQISEYSTQLAAAGLEAQGLVDLLIVGEQEGIFNDKAFDTVKEGLLRIRELPKATQDALTNIGISVEEVQRGLRDGTKTAFDVIQEVSGKLSELPPNAKEVGTAIADIFGGPGEDSGLRFITLLKDLGESTEDWKENLNDAQKAQLDYVDSQSELNGAVLNLGTSFQTTGTKIKTFFNNVLASTVNFLADTVDAFRSTENVLNDFQKAIEVSQDLGVLTAELERLKEAQESVATAIKDQAVAALTSFGIAGGQAAKAAKIRTERAIKIAALEKRITELQAEEEEKRIENSEKAARKQLKLDQDVAKERLAAQLNLQKQRLEQEAQLLEEAAQNEENTIVERLAAEQEASNKRIEIREIEQRIILETQTQQFEEEKQLIKERTQFEIEQIKIASEKRQEAIAEAAKVQIEEGDLSAIFDKAIMKRLDQLELAKNEELLLVEQSNMSLAEKEKTRFLVEEEFRRRALEDQLKFLRTRLGLITDDADERLRIAKQISELELALAKETADQEGNIWDERAAKAQEILDTSTQLAQAVAERQLADLDRQQEALESRKEDELALAGDNAEARANIEKKFAEEQRKIEEKRARIQRRTAIFEKSQAVFSIGVSTAKAIGEKLPGLPITAPLIALIGALGAAQIAAVLARPVPAFAEGTDSAPGGPAIVSEEGPELVIHKGEARLTPDGGPALVDLPRGAQVIDAITTQRILSNPESYDNFTTAAITDRNQNKMAGALSSARRDAIGSGSRSPGIDYERLGKSVAKHLPPQQITQFERDGTVKFFTKHKDGSVIENINKRTKQIDEKHPLNQEIRDLKDQISDLNKPSR